MIDDPSLIAIYFFKRDGVSSDQTLFNHIVENNKLTKLKEENGYKIYADSNRSCCAEWLSFYDIDVVRLKFNKYGTYQPVIWTDQKAVLSKTVDLKNCETFLGASIIYSGFINQLDVSTQYSEIQNGMGSPIFTLSNKTDYGWLWQIGDIKENIIEYVFLLQNPMKKKAEEEFLLARDRGIIKIDSHLHKLYNQLGYYEEVRKKLMDFAKELDAEQLKLVQSLKILEMSEQKERLDAVSEKYAKLVEKVSWANTIQNTMKINLENYIDRWGQVQGNEGIIMSFHQKRFERSLEQMKWDFNYYDTITKGVRTGLEVIRSMNLTSLQKEGLGFQAAVAVLESVFLFYYSLGIWHLLIEEEKWKHIPILDKAGVGLGLAITLALGSHFFFTKKNRNYYRICLAITLAILVYAIWVTNIVVHAGG